jgi:hypothetical protein
MYSKCWICAPATHRGYVQNCSYHGGRHWWPISPTGCARRRARRSRPPTEGLPHEKTNVDRGKKSNCQTRTDNQHNQRRSIENARSRLDRRLDDMSSFLVHKLLPRVRPCITTGGRKIGSGAQKLIRPLGDSNFAPSIYPLHDKQTRKSAVGLGRVKTPCQKH